MGVSDDRDKGRTASSVISTQAPSQRVFDSLTIARRQAADDFKARFGDRLKAINSDLRKLEDPPSYVRKYLVDLWLEEGTPLAEELPGQPVPELVPEEAIEATHRLNAFLNDPEVMRRGANTVYMDRELVRARSLFDEAGSHPLTEEQRTSVVIDENSNLVVAAAGSGKTSVLATKVAHMVHRSDRAPEEVLLLAFARDARAEMEQRLGKYLGEELGSRVTVRTFHALGLEIIVDVERRKPALAAIASDDVQKVAHVSKIIADLLGSNRQFATTMLTWFQSYFAPYESIFSFDSLGAYYEHLRSNEIRTLKGELVKSFEECEIANYLHLNGISYEYERPYEHETSSPDFRQYKPDFFLVDHGVYIEHFGLSREGLPPKFVDQQKYLDGVKWKREVHAHYKTTLIETFSYERFEGRLLTSLQEKLAAVDITPEPISPEDGLSALREFGRINDFSRLVTTFLGHFKSNQLTIGDLRAKSKGRPDRARLIAFLNVFVPIHEAYKTSLSDRGEIDFEDMIALATRYVEEDAYSSPFGYILVDEFQDISPGRARLLSALLGQSPANQLFCVGDDWQSIYRFAGSDISIMSDFERWFGNFERSDLCQTFRCPPGISDEASRFVMENPAQLHKDVRSMSSDKTVRIHIFQALDGEAGVLHEILGTLSDGPHADGERPTVMILARYNHQLTQPLGKLAQQYPNLAISSSTVHRSKGLEADYVIVIGLVSERLGFPTEIADDPLLDVVLAKPEAHANAEERRLFYVALTRAKRHVYLISSKNRPSAFVRELGENGYSVSEFGEADKETPRCPECQSGELRLRRGGTSKFFGCSNYPYCEFTQRLCGTCGEGFVQPREDGVSYTCGVCNAVYQTCPTCEVGWLEGKEGRYGRFLGCSNYPGCEYTSSVQK